ncbi:MAG: SMC-Scp complex subunit ScpB [candidate division Zixibacteria bacterium HGW-Zixibacteria-1]|nr:MAG: SMC-Scp complex subunit ScpB [candidate division Zixibacteria bacterium HGW-Zixibacteria-1]
MLEYENNIPIIESLIFSSPEPLPSRKISEVLDNLSNGDIDEAVEILNKKYSENDHAYRIRKIAGGYQVYIIESYARYVEELLARRRNIRLTRSALETMAIIAYRQPVTKTDIEMIRGVASDSVIHTLLQRKLVTLAGRSDSVGRPLLYKTTDEFLKFFNLNTLNDLPRMEEIEELLAARDYDSQPTLPLGSDDDTLPPSDMQDDDDNDLTEPDGLTEEIPVPAVDSSEESITFAEEELPPEIKDTDDDNDVSSKEVESVEEQKY